MPYTKFLFFNEPDRPDFIMDLIENHNYTLNEIYSFMEAVHNGMSWINVENTHIIQVISDEELKRCSTPRHIRRICILIIRFSKNMPQICVYPGAFI